MTGLEIAAIALLVGFVMHGRKGDCDPISLQAMEKQTRPGIDNTIPANLRTRATGLGIVAGRIQCSGIGRVTSTFRSRALTDAIHEENTRNGVNVGFPALPGPGDHDQARGLDVAPPKPSSDPQVIAGLKARLLSSDVGPLIEKALAEDNHVHVRFNETALEEIGKRISVALSCDKPKGNA